jgi:glycine/serine hydroxymethyltransferase
MEPIVSLIDEVIQQPENEKVIEGVAAQVHKMMAHRPLFNV